MKNNMDDVKYQNLVQYALAFFTFISISIPSLTSVSIILLSLTVILAYVKKSIIFKWNKISLLFFAFYLAYLIGYFFSNNIDIATKYLEYKLSFVIYPILFSFQFKNNFFNIKWPIIGLVIGVFCTASYGVLNAFICSSNGGENCFVTVSISPIHHPTYFMTYVVFAIATAWYGWNKHWKYFSLYWIIPYSLLGILLHTYALSFSGLLFLMIVFGCIALYFIYKKWGKLPAFGLVLIFPLVAFIAVKKVPSLRGEYNGSVKYVSSFIENPTHFIKDRKENMSGSEQRLVMWLVAYEQIKEQPMGVGTGDVDDVLGKRLKELGREQLAEKKLNPHNQFLQTTVEIGVLGLLILLSIVTIFFAYGWKYRNWLLLIIVGSLVFNSLFESMLQRQSGIVFYTFWMCLLVLIPKKTD